MLHVYSDVLVKYHKRIMEWLNSGRRHVLKYFAKRKEALPTPNDPVIGGLRTFCTLASIAQWRQTHPQRFFLDDDLLKRNYFHLKEVENSPQIQQWISDAERKYNKLIPVL